MASQQQQIIDTIFSMKRKLLRGNDCMYKPPPFSTRACSQSSADLEEADSPFADSRQDLKRKSQYARASDPDFLSDPRPHKKVRLPALRDLGTA